MKTRSNMPLFVVETDNITALSNSQIDLLRCGDYLVKKTGNQRHAYKVTYKEDKHGICLSYFAAGYTETVSYDYTDGNWVYNSTDIVYVPTPAVADNGKVLGVNASGEYELQNASGGTEVIANPTLAGTESDLLGLQVGDTKYRVMETHLYEISNGTISFFYESTSDFSTRSELVAELYSKGFNNSINYYPSAFMAVIGDANIYYGIYATNTTTLKARKYTMTATANLDTGAVTFSTTTADQNLGESSWPMTKIF